MIILGRCGQLAKAFKEILNDKAKYFGRSELDLLNSNDLSKTLTALVRNAPAAEPKALINTAAFTDVDLAETDRNTAYRLNVEAPRLAAQWAADNGYLYIHYSTDYVYNGIGAQENSEDEITTPINYYGESKLLGEDAIIAQNGRHLIFRTAWLFGAGNNFPRTLINLARSREELSVVFDQVGNPTHTNELARCSLAAISQVLQSDDSNKQGVFNLSNSGIASKFELAEYAIKNAEKSGILCHVPTLKKVPSTFYPTPAKRPLNSRLNLGKFISTFGFEPRPWRTSLLEWLSAERSKL